MRKGECTESLGEKAHCGKVRELALERILVPDVLKDLVIIVERTRERIPVSIAFCVLASHRVRLLWSCVSKYVLWGREELLIGKSEEIL